MTSHSQSELRGYRPSSSPKKAQEGEGGGATREVFSKANLPTSTDGWRDGVS